MEKLTKKHGEIYASRNIVYSYPLHMHTYYEMTYYESFEGSIFVNGQQLCINKPSVVLVIPSDFHRISVDDCRGAHFIKISFDASVLPVWNLPGRSFFSYDADAFVREAFLEAESNKEDKAYITILINAIIAAVRRKGKSIATYKNSVAIATARSAIKYINENFTESITLSDTALFCGVTPQYMSTIFKESTGVGFSEYLTGLRLTYAAELADEADLSVTEICFDCGYSSLSHFLRAFKKRYGLTPGEYKKRNR